MNSGMNVPTAQRDDWRTPERVFRALDRMFHFTIDAAADRDNAKLLRFWTAQDNALVQSWAGERVFCNPPFSLKGEFACKAAMGGAEVAVLILPSSPEQGWFHEWVIGPRALILVPRGRIEFDPPPGVKATNPRFASVIAVYKAIAPSQCIVESIDFGGDPR